MDLQTMQGQCRDRFRDPNQDVFDNSDWADYLNAAYFEFLRAAKWPFLVTSTDVVFAAGVRFAALTTTVTGGGIKDVKDQTNGRFLQEGAPRDEMLRRFLETQDSRPIWWQVVGSDLYILPASTASVTIKVFHYTTPARLSAPADTPVLPDLYHDAIISGALERAHHDDGNPALAERYRKEFDSILVHALRDLEEEQGPEPVQPVSTGSPV